MSPPAAALSDTELRAKVRTALGVLYDNMAEVTDDSDLGRSLVLDSLDLIEVEMEIDHQFNVDFDLAEELRSERLAPFTVAGIAAWLALKLAVPDRNPDPDWDPTQTPHQQEP